MHYAIIIIIGSKRWSSKERQQFRRAWRTHRKKFTNSIDTKTFHNIIEYYYSWKKYCPDEYRGRNRHVSEDVRMMVILQVHIVEWKYI